MNELIKYQIVYIIPLKLNVQNAQKIIKLLMENAFTVIIQTLNQVKKLAIRYFCQVHDDSGNCIKYVEGYTPKDSNNDTKVKEATKNAKKTYML